MPANLLLNIVDSTAIVVNRTAASLLSWVPFFADPLLAHPPSKENAVLITGTSSGIGFALTHRLAEMGYTVLATVRREEDGERLKEGAKNQKISERIRPYLMDVAQIETLPLIVEQILEEGRRGGWHLVGLVNNAGISINLPLELSPAGTMELVMRTNALGPAELTRLLIPSLRETQGRVVNIGSIMGFVQPCWFGPYGASKSAIQGWTEALRREMRPFGVGVSLIEAGFISTEIGAKSTDGFIQYFAQHPAVIKGEDDMEVWGYNVRGHREFGRVIAKVAPGTGHVTDIILDALQSSYPQTRYLVGWDARVMYPVTAVVPDMLVDPMTALVFWAFGLKGEKPNWAKGVAGGLAITGVVAYLCL